MASVVVDIPARRVDVTGTDRVRYLEDVSTQHLTDLPVTHVRGALVLDTHGAPTAMFDVVALGDRLALLAPDEAVAATLTDVLGMRTFLLDATFTACDTAALAVRGEDAEAVVATAGLTVVRGRCRVAGDLLVVSRSVGIDVHGPVGALARARDDLLAAGATSGTAADLDAWRVRLGEPAWAVEVRAPHLPEEFGLLPTHVHLAKGCYPGQEAVARMWMLGRPRRRLAIVAIEGPLGPGWTAGTGRDRAEVTTVDPATSRALAFVPAAAGTGAVFAGEPGERVQVERLVGAEDPPGHDPAVTRRRDRR